jgi:hypothetical protein
VVVDVRGGAVILLLVRFAAILVRVHECGVIVLMHVVVGLVCELAHGTTGVVMGHVPVIVGMDLAGVMVFMLLIADDDLLRLDRHAVTSFAVALRSSRHASA